MQRYKQRKLSKIHHQIWRQDISLFSTLHECFLVLKKLLLLFTLVLAGFPHPWGEHPYHTTVSFRPACQESPAAEVRH